MESGEERVGRGWFQRFAARVVYTAFVFPGLGQWLDGHRVRGLLIMLATTGALLIAFGRYLVASVRIGTCPGGPGSLGEMLPCFKWVVIEAWSRSASVIWAALAAFALVYIGAVAEAVIVVRARR